MEQLWGLLQGAVRLIGVRGHLRPLSRPQPPLKPQGRPLPFPLQSLPSSLTLGTLFLALCSYGTPKSLTLFLPVPPCPPHFLSQSHAHLTPTEKVVPTTLSDHLQACGRHPAGVPGGGRGRRGGGGQATRPLLSHGAEGPRAPGLSSRTAKPRTLGSSRTKGCSLPGPDSSADLHWG